MSALLIAQDLSRRFGGLLAVSDLSFEVRAGEVLGLIGPNGAGKSTTFNVISGFYRPTSGRLSFRGEDITGMSASAISRRGLVRTFQHGSLLRDMSVHDNILIGALRTVRDRRGRQRHVRDTAELLGLGGLLDTTAGSLPHGHQRMLSIAIALAARPTLLCLDEPLTGLNSTEIAAALGSMQRIRQEFATTIMLVDHNMRAVMRICDRIVVLKPRAEAGRGHTRRHPQRSRGDPRLSGRRRVSDAVLEITGLTIAYGQVRAVSDIHLSVLSGRITTLIGSNGAGKTTIMKGVTGLKQVASGGVRFRGEQLIGRPVDAIVAAGVSLVPEGRRLFPTMSVRENLEIGAYRRSDAAAVRADFDRVLDYFPALRERLDARAMALSGGQQQMVAIGRALMSGPKLLLLDEPSIGLAPTVVQTIGQIIQTISRSGVDVLLVEQNAHMALKLSDDAYVLENGAIVMQGNAQDLMRSEAVREAYLGL